MAKVKKTLEAWLKEVNSHLSKEGLDYRDLPDQPYADWHANGVSAKSAAKKAKKGIYE